MSLVFRLAHPPTPTGPATDTDLGNAVVRLDGVELSEAAEVGDTAMSDIAFDDPAGTLDIPAFYQLRVYENSLASNSLVWAGYIGDRTVERGESFLTGAARRWTADLMDMNAVLGFTLVTSASGNRPAETVSARLTWMFALPECPVADGGITPCYPNEQMDAADYRGQTLRDVVSDMAALTGYNFHVRLRESDNEPILLFYHPSDTTYGSPVRISNVLADVDSVWTFAPYDDAQLRRSASRVASGVWLPYQGGNIYLQNYSTSSNFTLRDLVAPMANVHTASMATAIASNFLAASMTEDDQISVSIRIPKTTASQILTGQRMQVRFSHLPGWESYRWTRVRRRTLVQSEGTADSFLLRLELSPVESGTYCQARLYAPSNSTIPAGGEITPAVYFRGTGDAPPSGRQSYPSIGPVSLVTYPFGTGNYSGIQVNGDGRVDVRVEVSMASVIDSGVHGASVQLLRNGDTVYTWSTATNSPGLSFWSTGVNDTLTDVCVSSGDTFSVRAQIGGGHSTTVPAGVGELTDGLSISGTVRP